MMMAILGKWSILRRLRYFNNQRNQGNDKSQEVDGVNLTNLTGLPMCFSVEATDPGVNCEEKPSRGIAPSTGTRRIDFTAIGIPLVKQEEKPVDFTFEDPQFNREEDIVPVLRQGHYPLRHDVLMSGRTFQCVEQVCGVPLRLIEIPYLMNKAAKEVLVKNSEAALETLREAIELYPDGFVLLCHALVNHLLDRKEGVKLDLQEAGRLFSLSEFAEGTGEHIASSEAYSIISDFVEVPIYTKERLGGEQMIVEFTKDQRFVVKVCLTPFTMLRPDGDVDVIVIVDSLRFGMKSNGTDSYPDHFLQNCKFVVRPAGKWSESFPDGCGLIDWRPGNEITPLMVQKVRARGIAAGVSVGANPAAGLHLNWNKSSGTTFPAFGLKKATSDGHAYVFEYELRTFEDGTSAQDLRGRRFYRIPKIPEAVRDEVNYPNLGKDEAYKGTWRVPYATAVELRNELGFTISVEAKLLAVFRCREGSLTHLFKPLKEVFMEQETRRMCVFAIAGLKSFIGENTRPFSKGVMNFSSM